MYKSFHIIHKFKGEDTVKLDVNTNTSIVKNKKHSNSFLTCITTNNNKINLLFWRNITWFGWVVHTNTENSQTFFSHFRCCSFHLLKLRHDILFHAGYPLEHRASSHATTANFIACWALRVAPSEICHSLLYLISFSSWLTSRWDLQGRPSSHTFFSFCYCKTSQTNWLQKLLFTNKSPLFFSLNKALHSKHVLLSSCHNTVWLTPALKHNKIHWSVCVSWMQ